MRNSVGRQAWQGQYTALRTETQSFALRQPANIFHSGDNSYYIGLGGLFGVEEGHVVDDPSGIQAHYDAFGPYNPMHAMETIAGAIVNVPLGSYSCSVVGGCHQ